MANLRIARPCLAAAACLAAAFTLAGCREEGNPAMPGGTPRSWADSAFGTGNVRWSLSDVAGAGSMRPELDGPRVYFERELDITPGGTVLGPARLVALDRETGAQLWSNPIVSATNAAVAGSTVGATWGGLPIFDRASGAEAAVFRYGSTSLASNVASDGARFYAASHNGHALAVTPAGAVAWDTDLAGSTSTAGFGVTLAGDDLAVVLKHFRAPGSTQPDSGIVAMLDRASGAVRWRRTLEPSIADPTLGDPPVIVGGLVIVVTAGHDVRAFDVRTGQPRWSADVSYAAQEFASGGLAACDGLVIVPTGDLGLAALDAATGQLRWRRGTLSEEGSLFSVQCSFGTVMTLGARLRVFDAATGTSRAAYPLVEPDVRRDPFWIDSVVRDDQFLYVGSTFGYAKVKAP